MMTDVWKVVDNPRTESYDLMRCDGEAVYIHASVCKKALAMPGGDRLWEPIFAKLAEAGQTDAIVAAIGPIYDGRALWRDEGEEARR